MTNKTILKCGGENIDDNNTLFVDYPDVITVEDLQSILHIGRNTAYKILQDEMIKTVKIGKKYIIPKASVVNFVSAIS